MQGVAEPVKVELAVAGHMVTVEAHVPMREVAATALALFYATAGSARRSPVGFAATGGQFELADGPGRGELPDEAEEAHV